MGNAATNTMYLVTGINTATMHLQATRMAMGIEQITDLRIPHLHPSHNASDETLEEQLDVLRAVREFEPETWRLQERLQRVDRQVEDSHEKQRRRRATTFYAHIPDEFTHLAAYSPDMIQLHRQVDGFLATTRAERPNATRITTELRAAMDMLDRIVNRTEWAVFSVIHRHRVDNHLLRQDSLRMGFIQMQEMARLHGFTIQGNDPRTILEAEATMGASPRTPQVIISVPLRQRRNKREDGRRYN